MAHYNLYGMKRRSQIKISILALVLAFAVTLGLNMLYSVSAATTTTVVTGNTVTSTVENDSEGWWFNRDQKTKTPYEFTNDVASIGAGSLYVEPITNTHAGDPCSNSAHNKANCDKFVAENFVFMDADELESISYDFMIAGNGTPTDANDFYLNVYTNNPGVEEDNFYTCRFDFTPTVGSTTNFETATFSATNTPTHVQARGSGTQCPTTLAGLEEGSTIRMFAISVGDTSANDTGLAGYLDNVILATTGDTTIYDFEQAPLENKEQCKTGGYADYGFRNQGLCIQFVNTGKDSRN